MLLKSLDTLIWSYEPIERALPQKIFEEMQAILLY